MTRAVLWQNIQPTAVLAHRYQSLVREADAHKATGEQAAGQLKNHALEYMSRMKSAQLHRSRHRQLWEEAYKCAPRPGCPYPVTVTEGLRPALGVRLWDGQGAVACAVHQVLGCAAAGPMPAGGSVLLRQRPQYGILWMQQLLTWASRSSLFLAVGVVDKGGQSVQSGAEARRMPLL